MVMVELYSTWDVAATDALVAAYEKMAAGMKVQQKQAAAAATQAAESKLETLVRQEKQAGQTLRKCRGTLERLIGEYDEAVGAHKGSEIIGVCLSVCPPELKVRTPAHTEHPGWYLEFESRVTQVVKHAEGEKAAAADVSASLSTRQIWTAVQHDGPNHLGVWLIR